MDTQIKQAIGKRLEAALQERRILQKELAKYLDVKDNVISFFCTGARVPNHVQLVQIAKYLDVSTDYLLGLTDVMASDKDQQFISDCTGLSQKAIEKLTIEQELKEQAVPSWVADGLNLLYRSDRIQHYFRILFFYLNSENVEIGLQDMPFSEPESLISFSYHEPNSGNEKTYSEKPDDSFIESLLLAALQNELAKIKTEIHNGNKK